MIVGKKALDVWRDRIRKEVVDLVENLEATKGHISLETWREMRMNSYEGAALMPFLDDEALAWMLEHSASNASIRQRFPPIVYDDQLANVLVPLAVERMRNRIAKERRRRESSDLQSVRRTIRTTIASHGALDALGYALKLADEVETIRETLDAIGHTLISAGYGHRTEGHPPIAPPFFEYPLCIEYLAEEAKKARILAEEVEAWKGWSKTIAENLGALLGREVEPSGPELVQASEDLCGMDCRDCDPGSFGTLARTCPRHTKEPT